MKPVLVAAMFASSAVLFAQTGSASADAVPTASMPPPPLDPAQVLAAFAPGAGREVTAAACGTCHSPMIITGKRLDADAWAQMVDQMIGRGALVEDKDYDTIVDYLAANYGPDKT